ncbi:MAG: DinB family protein [Dehalococcoidia bacterium]
MSETTYPPLDIASEYARVTDHLISLVDCVPDDKLEWSPKPELWNLKGILLHVAWARHGWLGFTVQDGETSPDVLRAGQTRDGLKEQLRLSGERLQRFLADPGKLAGTYEDTDEEGATRTVTGHWVAYHLLEHDIHHRANVFDYLALLGIEHPQIETP